MSGLLIKMTVNINYHIDVYEKESKRLREAMCSCSISPIHDYYGLQYLDTMDMQIENVRIALNKLCPEFHKDASMSEC